MDGESINSQILLQANISLLLPVFEQFLDMAPDTSAHDTIRQSVIILMGCLARHLDKDDPKVSSLFASSVTSDSLGLASIGVQYVQQRLARPQSILRTPCAIQIERTGDESASVIHWRKVIRSASIVLSFYFQSLCFSYGLLNSKANHL